MKRRFSRLTLSVFLILAASTAPLHAETDTPGTTSDDYGRARALYRQASEAFEGGHYSEARELLEKAWALRQSYDVAASLGDTEVKLGLFPEAAEHLSYSIRNFPPLENEQALASVRRQFDVAREQVAALHIAVNEPGAEVRVDQRVVGTSPIADPVFVAPGTHTIEARKGSAVATREWVGRASDESSLSLELGRTTAPLPDEVAGPRSVVPLIVGGAVLAVGLTAGIAFRLSASADDDHASGIRARLGQGACAGSAGASADCTTLRNDVDDSNRSKVISTVGFAVAGVAAVATPVWWLLTPRPKRPPAVGFSATAMPGFAGVSAAGRF